VLAQAGSALAYADANAGLVDSTIRLTTPYDILAVEEPFDAVLTVMDPWAALLGARRGVPVFYVDSLFWFWDWSGIDFESVPDAARWWVHASRQELHDASSRPLNWHHITPLAYHWSTRVFAQRGAGVEARARQYPPGQVAVVGAVIDPPPSHPDRSGVPLVSISGAVSHLTPLATAGRYARMVRRIVELTGEPLAKATVTGNPSVLDAFESGPWEVRPTSGRGMHEAMSRAPMLLAPAGLTTALEAAALGTPLILLPEQHGGHGSNADLLQGSDPTAYDDILLRRWAKLRCVDPKGAITELDELYQRILSGQAEDLAAAMISALHTAIERLSEPRERAARVERQRANVLDLVGDFDGARTVGTAISEQLAGTGTGSG
jgi:hypothetical protein